MRDDPKNLVTIDTMWRLLIGLGCVPGVIALYYRLTIPETPRFTMDIARNVYQAADDVDNFLKSGTFVVNPDAFIQRVKAPKASRKDFRRHFSQWKNKKILIGTCWSWFAIDVRSLLLVLVLEKSTGSVADRVLRLRSQYSDYPRCHWLWNTLVRIQRNRSCIPESAQHLHRKLDLNRRRSNSRCLPLRVYDRPRRS